MSTRSTRTTPPRAVEPRQTGMPDMCSQKKVARFQGSAPVPLGAGRRTGRHRCNRAPRCVRTSPGRRRASGKGGETMGGQVTRSWCRYQKAGSTGGGGRCFRSNFRLLGRTSGRLVERAENPSASAPRPRRRKARPLLQWHGTWRRSNAIN